jgi:hypothetical protein
VTLAVYSSINETVDSTQLVEDGYYAAPKSADKVGVCVCVHACMHACVCVLHAIRMDFCLHTVFQSLGIITVYRKKIAGSAFIMAHLQSHTQRLHYL